MPGPDGGDPGAAGPASAAPSSKAASSKAALAARMAALNAEIERMKASVAAKQQAGGKEPAQGGEAGGSIAAAAPAVAPQADAAAAPDRGKRSREAEPGPPARKSDAAAARPPEAPAPRVRAAEDAKRSAPPQAQGCAAAQATEAVPASVRRVPPAGQAEATQSGLKRGRGGDAAPETAAAPAGLPLRAEPGPPLKRPAAAGPAAAAAAGGDMPRVKSFQEIMQVRACWRCGHLGAVVLTTLCIRSVTGEEAAQGGHFRPGWRHPRGARPGGSERGPPGDAGDAAGGRCSASAR